MPSLLRRESIRLLEASIESLQLAVSSLGSQKRISFRQPQAEYSIEIGLIGAAAELAMGACLVQAYGSSAIVWPTGQFKTAGAILNDFRDMLKSGVPNSAFITQGVEQPIQHRESLLEHTNTFRRLIPVRAAGLHAGRGQLFEATISQANEVAEFLELLRLSNKISPYISHIPKCMIHVPSRNLLVEDIARRLQEAQGEEEVATALSSLYLVLPDIPEDTPTWLEAFDRVAVAPKKRDINYLLKAIEPALPVSLRRITSAGDILPVTVQSQNPNALPIAPQYLKREFNKIRDLWYADVSLANGRLNKGSLDLPPIEAVREVFAIGLIEAGILQERDSLGPHESWVSIAASLNTSGTTGPYWFLVRKTEDLGQLMKQLQRASSKGKSYLRTNIESSIHGIKALNQNRQLSVGDRHFSKTIESIGAVEEKIERLAQQQEKHAKDEKALPKHLVDRLEDIVQGEPVGILLRELIATEEVSDKCLTYWGRVLCEIANSREDAAALIEILGTDTLSSGVHTAARQALRRIDFGLYGPSVNWD
jgi:hypothetical protein